jgi:hypothetical protein
MDLDLFQCRSLIVFSPSEPRLWRHASIRFCDQSLLRGRSCSPHLLARIMHEPPVTTADMAILPGVLGSRTLRRTVKYALGPSPCGCPVARPSPRSRDGVSCIMRARKREARGEFESHPQNPPRSPFSKEGCRGIRFPWEGKRFLCSPQSVASGGRCSRAVV